MIYRQVSINGDLLYVPEHLVGTLVGVLAMSINVKGTENWGVSIVVLSSRMAMPYEARLSNDPNHETIEQAGV